MIPLTSKITRKWKKTLVILAVTVFGGFSLSFLYEATRPSAHQFILYREQKLTEEEKLHEMGSRYSEDIVRPNEATVYVQPTNLVKWGSSISQDEKLVRNEIPSSLRILIVVTSTPNSFERRKMIRSTWKKWILPGHMQNVKVVFFIGSQKASLNEELNVTLRRESADHDDLVIDDFSESYFRLTPKTLRILKWYLQTYGKFQSQSSPHFLVKTDHDVFINIPNLVAHLTSIYSKTPQKYLGGHKYSNPQLDLNPESKFYFSPEFWLNSTTPMWILKLKNYFGIGESPFPDYIAGPCYMMSTDIVHRLYEASFNTPLIIFEDVYLTGFVRRQVNLTLNGIAHSKLSIRLEQFKEILEDVTLLKEIIALHPAEPLELMSVAFDKTDISL